MSPSIYRVASVYAASQAHDSREYTFNQQKKLQIIVTQIIDLVSQPCVMSWNMVITFQRLGSQTPEHIHRSFCTTPESFHVDRIPADLWVTLVSADYLYICRD